LSPPTCSLTNVNTSALKLKKEGADNYLYWTGKLNWLSTQSSAAFKPFSWLSKLLGRGGARLPASLDWPFGVRNRRCPIQCMLMLIIYCIWIVRSKKPHSHLHKFIRSSVRKLTGTTTAHFITLPHGYNSLQTRIHIHTYCTHESFETKHSYPESRT